MGRREIARLDQSLVRSIAAEFPKGKWRRITGLEIINANKKTWKSLKHLRKVGGNYAFLFPERFFSKEREILLHAPSRRQVPFRYCLKTIFASDEYVAAYVGKASNLAQRIQWHFSLAKRNTGAQVQYGLVNSKICRNRSAAVKFMLEHSIIYYRDLHGDGHVANRDLLELSLCARFAPPFNIKSER